MGAIEILIGVDFSGASKASSQRKKIIGIAATRIKPGTYVVQPDGFNSRLVRLGQPRGRTAEELVEVLLRDVRARVVAFDFPFSIPAKLLKDEDFASLVGHSGAFETWAEFNHFVADHLPLQPPLDFSRFAQWRNTDYWVKRTSDPPQAQPALKHVGQVLFNMTLLGNTVLSSLAASGLYRIIPFDQAGPSNEVIEIYPGITMSLLGFHRYKQDLVGAIDAILNYCAGEGIAIEVDSGIRHFCETYNSGSAQAFDPDGSDALIALATAILYREGVGAEVVEPAHRDHRLMEGVIWGPRKASPLTNRAAIIRPLSNAQSDVRMAGGGHHHLGAPEVHQPQQHQQPDEQDEVLRLIKQRTEARQDKEWNPIIQPRADMLVPHKSAVSPDTPGVASGSGAGGASTNWLSTLIHKLLTRKRR